MTTCEKLCGDGRNRRSRDIRMGKPGASKVASSTFKGKWEGNPVNWNILVAGGKEREIDSLSSGERNGKSPNRHWVGVVGPQCGKNELVELPGKVREKRWNPCIRKRGKPSGILSTTRHVKPCWNQRRPLRKAKYSLVTDSEPVLWRKVEKNPGRGVK